MKAFAAARGARLQNSSGPPSQPSRERRQGITRTQVTRRRSHCSQRHRASVAEVTGLWLVKPRPSGPARATRPCALGACRGNPDRVVAERGRARCKARGGRILDVFNRRATKQMARPHPPRDVERLPRQAPSAPRAADRARPPRRLRNRAGRGPGAAHVLPMFLEPALRPFVGAAERSIRCRAEDPHMHVVVMRL